MSGNIIRIGNEQDKNDKECIEIEEQEKMMNKEKKAQDKTEEIETQEVSKIQRTDSREGREVKPKKIPIGGIQMPGFFTRSKSKEKCKDGDSEQGGANTEGTELLERNTKDNEEDKQEETPTRIKIPFMKKIMSADEKPEDDKSGEQSQKRNFLNSIKIPMGFPKRQKTEDRSGNQSTQAGLASMETLGDDDKTLDKKDDMQEVKLDADKTDVEKQDSQEKLNWGTKLRAYRAIISAVLVFILIFIIILALVIPGKPLTEVPPRDGKYVEAVTSCGPVEGLLDDGAVAFRGIPYALSPLGPKRWAPAAPLDNLKYCWNGTFIAHDSTPFCSQLSKNGTVEGVEDCLTLDVVTPYVRYTNPLPVIVMIGSDNLMGGSPGKMRPSARYARSRDVIFVRPNFRIGPMGFLALKTLSDSTHPPTSGNYGLSDIILALKWVQLNIQHFGGDAEAVTLFGHKAGATLVTALAYSNSVKGLFARAWATSGAAIFPGKSLKESEKENEEYLTSFSCVEASCLRDNTIEAEKLIEAVPDTWRKAPLDLPLPDEQVDKRHEWLILDGKYLKEHPAQTWTKEDQDTSRKLILGTTAHSGASNYLLDRHKPWTPELVKAHIQNSLIGKMNLTEEVLSRYPATYQGLVSMVSDIRIVCPLLAISIQQRGVPFYVVTQTRVLQTDGSNQFVGEDLADIDSDIDAILGRYEPKTPEQRRYVTAIQQLFYHYIWHGEVLQTENVNNKVLVVGQDVIPSANYTHCDFWIKKDIVPKYAQLD